MTLDEGRRVRLATEIRLFDPVAVADDRSSEPAAAFTGSLSLAAGTEGTVERAVEHHQQSGAVREYVRLKSLLDDFGRDMPAESKGRLEEQVRSLEPEWIAHERRGPVTTVRVRFDNGFILDEVPDSLFVPLTSG
ncbi:hypothetical protein ACFWUW_20415 [Streptomyces sp. NPDC058655]|uniref:hypothetical protein n=1 Tax=Streptomyces sp. NPDC058655 TaxID=3346577 RepID=UPI0036656C8D